MKLRLARRWFTERSTIGQCYVDDIFECFVLEDVVRRDPDPSTPANEAKVPGRTAIPAGRYRIVMRQSPKFGVVPELLDVPGFTDILIHAGNTDADTQGCLLVGRERGPDRVGMSRAALDALLPKIREGRAQGELWLEIEEFGTPPPEVDAAADDE